MRLVTLDSSVIVASLLAHDPRHEQAAELLNEVFAGTVQAVMPCSVLVEVVAAVRRRTGSQATAREVEETLLGFPGFAFVDITIRSATEAARIGASAGLRGMDALVVQTSIEHGAELVTFDEEMRRKARRLLG